MNLPAIDSSSRAELRWGGACLLLAGLLPLPAQFLLPASGWPDSVQGMPAEQALQLFRDHVWSFRAGYMAMGLAGLFFLPAALHLVRELNRRLAIGGASLIGHWLLGLAIASGALRSLWYFACLTVVPVLDRLWLAGDATTRAAVNVSYQLFNDLMSTVQEDVGVNLIGGAFFVLLGWQIWRSKSYPRSLGVTAALAGLAFIASSSEFLGITNGPVLPFIGPVVSSLTLAAFGTVELLRVRRTSST